MKYITTLALLDNGKLKLDKIYAPDVSITDVLYFRVVLGNLEADKVSVIVKGSVISKKVSMYKKYPGIYECRLDNSLLKGLLSDSISKFSGDVIITKGYSTYTANTGECILIRGCDTSKTTDIADLYSKINKLSDKYGL